MRKWKNEEMKEKINDFIIYVLMNNLSIFIYLQCGPGCACTGDSCGCAAK
jgi:hypothetical protein